MNHGDKDRLICSRHNAYSWKKGDYCDECEVEKLQAENERLKAELAEAKSVPMKYRRMAFNAQLQEENERLKTELAAKEAQILELREALKHIATWELPSMELWFVNSTLATKPSTKYLMSWLGEPVARFNWNKASFEWLTPYKYDLHHMTKLYAPKGLEK